ncbi:MAG: beta-hydroxyacyl-ACP dehydratase [Myxococcota bacterium]|nr:beta-hydroxyacyl-ACP dehydratase [Myxococcota bacterium]
MADLMSKEDVLARVPQQEPFRFIDEIVELDLEHIVARYTFREDADFYRGHFPGNPVTPGVILIEAMAQAGVVAYGIYLYAAEHSPGEVDKLLTMFTDAQVDFAGMVKPGDRVTTTARKVFFRRKKLRCEMEMKLDDGTVVCSGVLSGMGVPR